MASIKEQEQLEVSLTPTWSGTVEPAWRWAVTVGLA